MQSTAENERALDLRVKYTVEGLGRLVPNQLILNDPGTVEDPVDLSNVVVDLIYHRTERRGRGMGRQPTLFLP